jgi:quercetin dioxygenase-like cupin family protein
VVKLPPGFAAPAHSHDHAEVFMVLEGSCEFDGEPMARFDLTVVEANQPYGFTAGPDGLSFLIVRQGAASFAVADS